MAIKAIEWIQCICDKCGKEWIPRRCEPLPIQCPYCQRRDWNKEKSEES